MDTGSGGWMSMLQGMNEEQLKALFSLGGNQSREQMFADQAAQAQALQSQALRSDENRGGNNPWGNLMSGLAGGIKQGVGNYQTGQANQNRAAQIRLSDDTLSRLAAAMIANQKAMEAKNQQMTVTPTAGSVAPTGAGLGLEGY